MRDKVVLITGGTAGFGAAMGKVWAQAGAKVAICGRDPTRLEQTVEMLRGYGGEVAGYAVDVTQDDQITSLFEQIHKQFQRLDALVNNVGRSTRGFAAETTVEQFRESMEANFYSAVRCTRAALPMLKETRGHLVFMGSLASKAAGPYLGAYPPSKFAVASYAQQLRLELAEHGVHVLLVCPGPIAREDAGRRYDEQASDLPESARRPGGGVNLTGIDPDKLAARILRACEKREPEVVWPRKARWLFAISQLSPTLGDWIIRRKTK
jgi:short-subunit dehydrogenase